MTTTKWFFRSQLPLEVGDKTAYLAEVHQAGIFTLSGLTPEQLHRTQHVFCLRFLHPYAIATLTGSDYQGRFPAVPDAPGQF